MHFLIYNHSAYMTPPFQSSRRHPRRRRRRSFLALLGASSIAVSSGCVGSIRGGRSHPRLGWVAVKNYHPEPHSFDIQILRGETVVHDSSHDIEGNPEGRIPGTVLECTWGDAPGPYTLRGRLGDGAWTERPVAHAVDESAMLDDTTECVIAEGAYARYGSHRFTWMIQDWCEEVSTYDGGCAFANPDS